VQFVDSRTPGATAVTVWSLQQTDAGQVRPPSCLPRVEPVLLQARRPAPSLSRYCYLEVGGPWNWVDRVGWDDDAWRRWVARPGHELWTCWVDGVLAGYFELDAADPSPGSPPDRWDPGRSGPGRSGSVELAYFGLTAPFQGVGLGGWLLTKALQQAWSRGGTDRVWVHTCSLDGPAALANYEARGLVRFDEQVEWRLTNGPGDLDRDRG
jgi:GNAT superfamily N-acetyltransferase